jgi:hypothetical protein
MVDAHGEKVQAVGPVMGSPAVVRVGREGGTSPDECVLEGVRLQFRQLEEPAQLLKACFEWIGVGRPSLFREKFVNDLQEEFPTGHVETIV